jgi:uncharacterized protein (DUF934 family)
MSEGEPRIWTRAGFVADRFGPASGAIFMTPEEATGKLGGAGPHVLLLESGDEPGAAAGRIGEFDAVFIRFAVFSDGRGFSTARLLREKRGFSGEIRARGHFILDQIPFLLRVGFDAFEVTHAPTIARLERNELPQVALHLQPGWGEEAPAGRAWRRR